MLSKIIKINRRNFLKAPLILNCLVGNASISFFNSADFASYSAFYERDLRGTSVVSSSNLFSASADVRVQGQLPSMKIRFGDVKLNHRLWF